LYTTVIKKQSNIKFQQLLHANISHILYWVFDKFTQKYCQSPFRLASIET